jgi:hypothetical protein
MLFFGAALAEIKNWLKSKQISFERGDFTYFKMPGLPQWSFPAHLQLRSEHTFCPHFRPTIPKMQVCSGLASLNTSVHFFRDGENGTVAGAACDPPPKS